MTHEICDACETVAHCSQHGCIPLQPQSLKPCRSPYCECTPGTCAHPGCYDARAEPFKHPTPAEKPYTVVRNAWTNKLTYTCNSCGKTDFRSEHAARFHTCEPAPVLEPAAWVDALFDAIKHGDQDHQNWLQEKLKSWVTANPPLAKPKLPTPVDWREAVLDLIDECPGLTMDQDRWLTQRVKEIANPPATLEKTSDPCPGCTPGHVCRTPACGRLQLPQDHPLRNLK
jgi:hypothetical protein